MEYLTLKVSTSSRGLIYERDFSAADIFGPYVQSEVAHLVEMSYIKENQLYKAIVIPTCDSNQDVVNSKIATTVAEPVTERSWLTMALDENSPKDMPIRYFTLKVSTFAPDANLYQIHVPVSQLNDVTGKIKTSLIQMGLIKSDEVIQSDLYACSGDAPRFNQDVVHALPDDLQDIQIEVIESHLQQDFPIRAMPECIYEQGPVREAPLVIFFKQDGFERLNQFVMENGSRKQEIGGILIGEVYRRPNDDNLFVEVEDFIPAEQTEADAVSLRFTHQSFQDLRDKKSALFPEKKLIVGWYHTHPPVSVTKGGREVMTTSFFSNDDAQLHSQFFSKPWQVALVMDAESDERVCFCWSNGTIIKSGFHVSA